MKKYAFLHPFIFAFASIIFIFLISSVTVAPSQAIRTLILFWGILVILIPIIYWTLKDWNLTSILLSIIAITFFSTQTFFQVEIIIIFVSVFSFYAYLYIRSYTLKTYHIVNILNLVSIIVVTIVTFSALKQPPGVPFFDIPQFYWKNRTISTKLTVERNTPDIYYIILDGYGREDILDEYYDYDNSKFIDIINSKGFIVPSLTHSNYAKTILSISSTLNMNYISEILPQLDNKETHYWWLLEPLIDYSDVRLLLENAGYASYSITSGWSLTDNPSTNQYYKPDPLIANDFEFVTFSVTPMKFFTPLLSNMIYLPSYTSHREIFHHNFSALEEISRVEGPKFVFAHIVSPHPPFVFDRNGEALTPNYRYTFNDANDVALTDEEYREGYINQLEFLNKNIENLVDDILMNSETPPIIILQADHGPGMYTDFRSYQNTCLHERFSVFAAYYLPGANASIIPQDITPVNLFRIIFNEYFDTDFTFLPHSHYFIEDSIQLFRSDDVTSIVDTCSTNQ